MTLLSSHVPAKGQLALVQPFYMLTRSARLPSNNERLFAYFVVAPGFSTLMDASGPQKSSGESPCCDDG